MGLPYTCSPSWATLLDFGQVRPPSRRDKCFCSSCCAQMTYLSFCYFFSYFKARGWLLSKFTICSNPTSALSIPICVMENMPYSNQTQKLQQLTGDFLSFSTTVRQMKQSLRFDIKLHLFIKVWIMQTEGELTCLNQNYTQACLQEQLPPPAAAVSSQGKVGKNAGEDVSGVVTCVGVPSSAPCLRTV